MLKMQYTQDTRILVLYNGTIHTPNIFLSILAYKITRYKLFITKHYRISSFLISMHLLWFAYACLFPRLFVILFLWFISWGVFPSTIFHSLKICVWNKCTMQYIHIQFDSTLAYETKLKYEIIIYKSFQSFLLEVNVVNRGLQTTYTIHTHTHTLVWCA